MNIMKAKKEDLSKLRELYDIAKSTMDQIGNTKQWMPGEPPNTEILLSIESGEQYVILDEDKIVGTFVFFLHKDPCYDEIFEGSWPNNEPYGTIHRIASDGVTKGILGEIFKYAEQQAENLRIDTHKDNAIMHHLLAKYGFKRAGIVYVKSGGERVAYARKKLL